MEPATARVTTPGALPRGPADLLSDGLLSDNLAARGPARPMSLSRPQTLTTAVATYIRDAIVHGQFAPGSRLPEVALAAQLATSRGTVREALRTLADGGLIEVVPRRGVFVTQLSVRATWEITSLRALLEPYASRLALEASGSDHVIRTEVEASFEVLRAAVGTGDPVTVADADVGFHRSVFARCGHKMLLSQLNTLQALSRRIVLTNQVLSADAPTLIAQHTPIVEAVVLRDPELLEAAVRTHVIEGGELLMTRMAALEPNRARRPEATSFGLGRWPSGATPHPRRSASQRQDGRRP
jgi:DNA-binding GntR family transcriptional regulator